MRHTQFVQFFGLRYPHVVHFYDYRLKKDNPFDAYETINILQF